MEKNELGVGEEEEGGKGRRAEEKTTGQGGKESQVNKYKLRVPNINTESG